MDDRHYRMSLSNPLFYFTSRPFVTHLSGVPPSIGTTASGTSENYYSIGTKRRGGPDLYTTYVHLQGTYSRVQNTQTRKVQLLHLNSKTMVIELRRCMIAIATTVMSSVRPKYSFVQAYNTCVSGTRIGSSVRHGWHRYPLR